MLRDFEGLSGHLHDYKVDIAKGMLQMAHALGAPLLLVCSSTSQHASSDLDAIARDLRKLAMLAVPLGIKIAYEGLSWGRTINEFTQAWEAVQRADAPNLGLGLDSYHALATKTALDDLDLVDPDKIFLVQLADFMWQETRTVEERISTARTFRVFPGEGVHSEQVAALVRPARRDGLPRRLQLRGLQRRLPAAAAAAGVRARAPRRPTGWASRCCAARCRCPGGCGCGAEQPRRRRRYLRRVALGERCPRSWSSTART